jgi:DNA-binding response OmpR family regulator
VLAEALTQRLDRAVEAARPSPAAADEAPRALVVDPERFSRRVVEGFLKREGYDVICVAELAGGVQRAELGGLTLVVVASDPPRLDGLEAVRRFRATPGTAGAAILLLTPRAELSEKLAAFQAGADDVVVTPFEPEEVVARVQAMVGRLRRSGANFAGAAG